jgi:hypothetical protein
MVSVKKIKKCSNRPIGALKFLSFIRGTKYVSFPKNLCAHKEYLDIHAKFSIRFFVDILKYVSDNSSYVPESRIKFS